MNEIQFGTSSLVFTVVGLLMTGLLWWIKRHIDRSDQRLDKIEANYLTTKALEKMQLERQDMHRENGAKLNSIDTKIDGLSAYVTAPLAVLTKRVDVVEVEVEKLRDWKHEKCEPTVRYVDHLQRDKPWERK